MAKRIMAVLVLMLVCVPAFAYKWVQSDNSEGGGYYRDTSNDGSPYNNANYLGANSRGGRSGVRTNTL